MAGRGRGLFLLYSELEPVEQTEIANSSEADKDVAFVSFGRGNPAPGIQRPRAPPLRRPDSAPLKFGQPGIERPRAPPRAQAPPLQCPAPATLVGRGTPQEGCGRGVLLNGVVPGLGLGGTQPSGVGQELPVTSVDGVDDVAAKSSEVETEPKLDGKVSGLSAVETAVPETAQVPEADFKHPNKNIVAHATQLRTALNAITSYGVNKTIVVSEFRPISTPAKSSGSFMQQVNKVTVKPQPKASERSPKLDSVLAENQVVVPVGKLDLEVGEDLEDPNDKPVKPQKITSLIQEVIIVNVEGVNNFYIKPAAPGPAAKVTAMELQMNKWYEQYAHVFSAPGVNELVKNGHYAAYITDQKAWRRVVARGWTLRGDVRVQLLDDGGAHMVHLENLRLLRRLFCKLPAQAFHAKLQMSESEAFTAAEQAEFKTETRGRRFLAGILTHENVDNELAPFHSVGVVLLQMENPPKPYTFGGRINFGYNFEPQNAQN